MSLDSDTAANEASLLVCIADDGDWLSAIRAAATTPVQALSWSVFAQSPLDHADPEALAIARIDAATAELDQRLGCLCRSFPSGVVVDVDTGAGIFDEQFFAHGFRQLRQNPKEFAYAALQDGMSSQSACGYVYRLHDYKAVPDWLNARYWAHPERFHL